MAKAQQIPGRTSEDDPQTWLANVLSVRFDEVLKYRDAALDPMRIDGIHDMRVAIRRLRSAIRDFAEIADKFPLQTLRKSLKRLADSLGGVRDADVLIEMLDALLPKAVDELILSGLAAIKADYAGHRSSAFNSLEGTLTEKFVTDLKERFDKAMEVSLHQRGLFQVSSVREAGGRLILKCRDEFFAHGEAIYFPSSQQRLHRLRIAGKHLRYAIELFEEVFGPELTQFAEETRKMQSYLGDVHDYDVWIAAMQARLKSNKRKPPIFNSDSTASAWLISQFIRRRTRAYRSALELWSKWETEGFAANLQNTVSQI